MNKRSVWGIVIILALVTGGFAYTQLYSRQSPATAETPRTIEVALAIADVLPAHRTEITEGATVLELLRMESAAEGFVLSEKEYAGLGILVELLGDFQNGTDGKYWTYTVNGAFAPVGADVYEPRSGDLIEWTFDVPDASY